jgi:hypothetical protein
MGVDGVGNADDTYGEGATLQRIQNFTIGSASVALSMLCAVCCVLCAVCCVLCAVCCC